MMISELNLPQVALAVGAVTILSLIGFVIMGMVRRRRLIARAVLRDVEDGVVIGHGASHAKNFIQRLGSSAANMTMVGQKEIEETEKLLIAAGYRTKGALYQVFGIRTVGLAIGLAVPVFVSQAVHHLQPMYLMPACLAGILLGWRVPMIVVGLIAKRRRAILDTDLPNAIDLLIICGEAGLSIEAGVDRIAREMKRSSPELSQEFAIVSAEMRILSDRSQSFVNLNERIQTEGSRSLSSTLSQAIRYGTPLGKALRVLSKEMRSRQQMQMEERAARLPVLITLPMICFILPCVFIVVGGPAFLEVARSFHT